METHLWRWNQTTTTQRNLGSCYSQERHASLALEIGFKDKTWWMVQGMTSSKRLLPEIWQGFPWSICCDSQSYKCQTFLYSCCLIWLAPTPHRYYNHLLKHSYQRRNLHTVTWRLWTTRHVQPPIASYIWPKTEWKRVVSIIHEFSTKCWLPTVSSWPHCLLQGTPLHPYLY